MVRLNNFIFMLGVIVAVNGSVGAVDEVSDDDRVVAGLALVERFYQCLADDRLTPDECAIFVASRFDLPLQSQWAYVRANKQLFLSGSETSDRDFFRNALKSIKIIYTQAERPHLMVGLRTAGPGKRHQVGIWKEIMFPIVRDKDSGRDLIDFNTIEVNGAPVDPWSARNMSKDMFVALGFRAEPRDAWLPAIFAAAVILVLLGLALYLVYFRCASKNKTSAS